MAKCKTAITFALVLVFAIALQTILIFADIQDSPNKAAAEFVKAYFAFDEKGLVQRTAASFMMTEDGNLVKQYVNSARERFAARGFESGCYTRHKLYHVRTETLSGSPLSASIRLTGERRSPLRSFFSGEKKIPVDVRLEMVREDGVWKVVASSLPFVGA